MLETTSKERAKFRQTREWKQFRLALIVAVCGCCEMCGTHYAGKRMKMLQVHHLKPDDYFNLKNQEFKVICSSCHDLVERMAIKKTWGEYAKQWHELLKDFMPKKESEL